MADIEVQEERIDPVENLSGWMDAKASKFRDAGPEEQTGESEAPASPAEPTVAQEPAPAPEAQAVPDWYESGLVTKHGFLKGRPGPEVEKAFYHAETAKQKAEREAAELRQQMEQMRRDREAEQAVKRVMQTPEPKADPDAEIDRLWFENPAEARRRIAQEAIESARKVTHEELSRIEASRYEAERTAQAQSAANAAVDWVAKEYGVDPETAAMKLAGTFVHITTHVAETGDDSVWRDPNTYASVFRRLYGDPQSARPIEVPPSPAPLSDPPGSKRPAASPTRPSEPGSLLTREQEEARKAFARIGGVDPKRLIERAKARGGIRG